ncbi:16S rRNA (adenine(1518)-N(6)/adenine(1519)-N(6))-dimethyltransferase RsmA [Mesomycoplasma molare]|uniref:Ribosomal RNA small subunit methyltransferase A n=1 Tax=Mesomycoplasma molare TaxID=171288 RepID=A0ABY5TV25_9BACT|nr:16S rRNA (adenine(1518)-N(6)/adenine(1519)-N(6))-dimethyltransferase RsmA [Mesomycoplasma molare]UWD34410.1 16S rRNA (adenine(1518)-N(6)/adenine(1519)-N(6))-dimethyltransferase RsmA [Mesomycoplasma molare]
MINKNIKAKKHLGQNFLIDKNIINKIIEVSEIKDKDVIEIGPGQGAITELLVKEAKSLIAYEIDSDMISILNSKIKGENFTLINSDFLKNDLNWKEKKHLVANLPYYITSDIIFKIFKNISLFSKMTIMVQEEVADRIKALKNTPEYSKLSVSCQFLAEIKKEFVVPPSCFLPKPKVNSAIITLNFKENLDQNYVNEFLNFIKICFSMKRKTLFNNLKTTFTKNKILEVLKINNLKENIRPQELEWGEYEKLFKDFKN